ncbi:MAG: COQ9 family protein [Wolbachia sp.]
MVCISYLAVQLNKYKNQNVAVFGLSKTGLSAINALIKSGARVYAWDDHEEQIANAKMMYKKCNFIHPKEYNWHEISALVLSPGVPTEPHWIVKLARRFDCKIKSDIELFLEAKTTNQKVIGITGTNGKSTTTSLIGHILKSAGKKVAIGGNLGVPVLDLERDAEIYVIEFSSFQLELMNEINVDISALLNITPDHIDRHGSMENYIATKLKLINGSEVAVIGCDNEITADIFNKFTGNKIPISVTYSPMSFQRVTLESRKEKPLPTTQMTEGGARDLISLAGNNLLDYSEQITGIDRNYLDPSVSYLDDKRGTGIQKISLKLENHSLSVSDVKINLISNAENVAAAYAVCKLLGVDSNTIINGIKSFSGLRHRNELLGKIRNVFFVNDSKATNAKSSEKAVLSYENINWIVGGRSKKGGIESLSKHFTRIRKAFLIGESTEAFANTMENKVDYVRCCNLEDAFRLAFEEALNSAEEVTILLSPACASFDQWKNFEERGEAFCRMFENLRYNHTCCLVQCCVEQKLIIDKLIRVIPFEGISNETLLKICTDLNLANSFCKFQNGIYSALEHIAEDLNSSMEAELRNSNLEDMKVRERVKLAIQIRLSNYAKLPNYRELLKNVLSFSVSPKNTYFSSKLLYRTISTIWYGIHDQSTDFNYYTKRAILAGVYLSTILFFINDYSEDFADTLSFLDNRINNVMTFQKFKTRLKGIIGNFL